MFPGRCFVSLLRCDRFRSSLVFIRHGIAFQRFEPHNAALKIKDDTKVSKKVAAEDAALLKARGLVHRFKIENDGVDFFARVSSYSQFRQLGHLYVFRNSGGAKDAHSALLDETFCFVELGQLFRQNGHRGAGVENEIKRLFDSLDRNLAAEKTSGSRPHPDVNSWSRCDESTVIVFAGAVDDSSEISHLATTLADQRQAACTIIN